MSEGLFRWLDQQAGIISISSCVLTFLMFIYYFISSLILLLLLTLQHYMNGLIRRRLEAKAGDWLFIDMSYWFALSLKGKTWSAYLCCARNHPMWWVAWRFNAPLLKARLKDQSFLSFPYILVKKELPPLAKMPYSYGNTCPTLLYVVGRTFPPETSIIHGADSRVLDNRWKPTRLRAYVICNSRVVMPVCHSLSAFIHGVVSS